MPPDTLKYDIEGYYLELQKEGQNLGFPNWDAHHNPFPGLRPFRSIEALLFFGRRKQVDELADRLLRSHFLGVLGSSGGGKSSLVRAGLIPALHGGLGQARASNWKIVICKPGITPLQNLAASLAAANLGSADEARLVPEIDRVLDVLKSTSFGLLDVEAGAEPGCKTLVVIDQFEELFRFQKGPNHETEYFVDLLLTAAREPDSPVYIVITMRSEFLGDCVRYRGLPELINEGQYLVPCLSGENIRQAITGPAIVVGATVAPTLVNRLVRELGNSQDQLPLLQHALMRTYRHWYALDPRPEHIGHADYEAVCGKWNPDEEAMDVHLEYALSNHANECYESLPEALQPVAELIFKRLVERDGRLPAPLRELYGIAQMAKASPEDVKRVIDQFRQADTSFLMPPPEVPLRPDTILDISHESLIRNWDLLKKWTEEEARNARLYRRLNEAREEKGLLEGARLENLIEWKSKGFNAFWAARYHAAAGGHRDGAQEEALFQENMDYLEFCIAEEERRKKAKEQEEEKRKKAKEQEEENKRAEESRQKVQRLKLKYRTNLAVLGLVAALVAGGFGWFAWQKKSEVEVQNVEIQRKNVEIHQQKQVVENALNQFLQEKRANEKLQAVKLISNAEVYIKAEQFALALSAYQEALELNPEDKTLEERIAFCRKNLSGAVPPK
ncbi:MAG: hypothetical protein IT260_20250 [Saprospiraceae bacterium]|nr:hypothetical protein [Saprospiraceae bacterium]